MLNQTQFNALVASLAADFKPQVIRIEASPETTQHHYADYGNLISQLAAGKNSQVAKVIALALTQAGANPVGVANGLKLFV